MNKTILMGRLTKDPEVRYTQTTNKAVATFTLAVNRRLDKEKTDFINIVAWNTTAEFVAKYFQKGQQVGVIGRIQVRDYENQEKKKVYVTEVVAEEVYFADSKKETNTIPEMNIDNTTVDDDLPF